MLSHTESFMATILRCNARWYGTDIHSVSLVDSPWSGFQAVCDLRPLAIGASGLGLSTARMFGITRFHRDYYWLNSSTRPVFGLQNTRGVAGEAPTESTGFADG